MTAADPLSLSGIDADAIARFVEVVFGHLDGHVPVRLLAEKGTPSRRPDAFCVPARDLAAALIRCAPAAARAGRAVFVVPGTVAQPGSARAGDIVATGVVLVDLDHGDVAGMRALLEQHLGRASLAVASGGSTSDGQPKLHLYWRLTEAAAGDDLERVRALRERIAAATGGDRSFRSLHQPIRVAGTIHGKHGVLTPVRIIEAPGLDYDLAELEEAVAGLPATAACDGPKLGIATGTTGHPATDLATRVIREGTVDGETRFGALSKVMGHWIRNARLGRCTQDEAWNAVVDHNAACIRPAWEEDRLRREFEALVRRDAANYPAAATSGDTPLSEDVLAALFVAAHGPDWRHVAAWGAWYSWSGCRWERDETGLVRERVRQVCRAAVRADLTGGEQRRIRSDRTIAAVTRIASCDPAIATRTSDWDAHPLLLNTPAGVVDLATGACTPPDRTLLLTQMTAASPGSGCARWMRFLDDVTGGDREMQAYLQRLSGYLLTGSTSEQMFAFFHGPGANGKSVFTLTLAAVMGDYAATATLDTFMASPSSRHLTELAGLRAARLVLVPETEAGRGWAEARIKSVTGGEKIRANFMHKDHFEYLPQFKLLVAGNHRPALSGVGEAMRRRLHVIPFEVTIPADRRDPRLADKLRAERDGILGWMLAGCAAWRQTSLSPPPAVVAAGTSYFADEDLLGQWIEECCEIGPTLLATARALFASWSAWAAAGGHPPGTRKSLGDALRTKGFAPGKVARSRGWQGLRPRGVEAPEDGR